MRLPASLRAAFYAASAVLAGSGIAWLVMRFGTADEPRGAEALALEVHGAAAMAVLALVGGVVALHAASRWRERRNRASGALLSALLLVLTASAYLLYYAGDDRLRGAASLAHWSLGLLAPVLGAWHVASGRPAGNSVRR
jgi:hypothetical protein